MRGSDIDSRAFVLRALFLVAVFGLGAPSSASVPMGDVDREKGKAWHSLLAPLGESEESAEGQLSELLEELKLMRDNAPVDLVREIANLGTREALNGLIEIYDTLGSSFMRKTFLRSFMIFDGNADSGRPALQQLMDVATGSKSEELRLEALEAIAGCTNLGSSFLAMIVESDADSEVRKKAMEFRAASYDSRDQRWFRALFEAGLGNGGHPDLRPGFKPVPQIRSEAFRALLGEMDLEALRNFTGDRQARVRRLALNELWVRADEEVLKLAEQTWREVRDWPENRAIAAKILLDLQGEDVAEKIMKEATRVGSSLTLMEEVAPLFAGMDSSNVTKKLLSMLKKKDLSGQYFAMNALRSSDLKDVNKSLRKMIRSKDTLIARKAMQILTERDDQEAADDLRKFLSKKVDGELAGKAFQALFGLRGDYDDWAAELQEFMTHRSATVRVAAVRALGQARDARDFEALTSALDDSHWSVRYEALRALAALRIPQAVPALIASMEREEPRLRHEIGGLLEDLTGKHYGQQLVAWKDWLEKEGEEPTILTEKEAERARRVDDERRERESSGAAFFGLEIHSKRMIFVLDLSRSMVEKSKGHYAHEEGERRIDIAKRELIHTLGVLDSTALINLISFSDKADPWKKESVPFSARMLDRATSYINKLSTDFGGTNLHAALKLAFESPDVDTIVILSDGFPSVGDIVDPKRLRMEVASWNEFRRIAIHCVALGDDIGLLRELSKDSNGEYQHVP